MIPPQLWQEGASDCAWKTRSSSLASRLTGCIAAAPRLRAATGAMAGETIARGAAAPPEEPDAPDETDAGAAAWEPPLPPPLDPPLAPPLPAAGTGSPAAASAAAPAAAYVGTRYFSPMYRKM